MWSFSIPTDLAIYYILVIKVNGAQLSMTPTLVKLSSPSCAPLRQATTSGVCDCVTGYVAASSSSACYSVYLQTKYLVAYGVSGGFVGLVLLAAFVYALRRRLDDNSWLIDAGQVVMPQDPEVLGEGAFGIVYKGAFRGTTVAVKCLRPVVALGPAKSRAAAGPSLSLGVGPKEGSLLGLGPSAGTGQGDAFATHAGMQLPGQHRHMSITGTGRSALSIRMAARVGLARAAAASSASSGHKPRGATLKAGPGGDGKGDRVTDGISVMDRLRRTWEATQRSGGASASATATAGATAATATTTLGSAVTATGLFGVDARRQQFVEEIRHVVRCAGQTRDPESGHGE